MSQKKWNKYARVYYHKHKAEIAVRRAARYLKDYGEQAAARELIRKEVYAVAKELNKKLKALQKQYVKDKKGAWQTVTLDELGARKDYLETVYENGKLVKEYTFDEVRKNAEI